MEFFAAVQARHSIRAFERRPVEEEKTADSKLCERGRLLYPTAYGYPESMGAHYEERQEAIRQQEEMRERPVRPKSERR